MLGDRGVVDDDALLALPHRTFDLATDAVASGRAVGNDDIAGIEASIATLHPAVLGLAVDVMLALELGCSAVLVDHHPVLAKQSHDVLLLPAPVFHGIGVDRVVDLETVRHPVSGLPIFAKYNLHARVRDRHEQAVPAISNRNSKANTRS